MAASREVPTSSGSVVHNLRGQRRQDATALSTRGSGPSEPWQLWLVPGGRHMPGFFPGPVPEILGHPFRSYLFCCLGSHYAFEELEIEPRPPQAGLLGQRPTQSCGWW